jgi:hypothetical protein
MLPRHWLTVLIRMLVFTSGGARWLSLIEVHSKFSLSS